MRMCDNHPNITKWASENVKIPYMNPMSGKYSNYVPDFMIQYIDKDGKEHVEVIEIKPNSKSSWKMLEHRDNNLNSQRPKVDSGTRMVST